MTKFEVTRHVEVPDGWYKLHAVFDTVKTKGNKAIKSIEGQVRYIRNETADLEPTPTQEEEPKTTAKKSKKKKVITDCLANLREGEKANLTVRLVNVGATKNFKSGEGTYCKCDIADDTGTMKLTLFGAQINEVQNVKENAHLKIENGYVKKYMNLLELSVGQYGKMEVIYP